MSGPTHDPASYRERDVIPIRRALVSVSDKTDLVELATALVGAGVQIVSTGSTASTIRDAGLAVTEVAEVTGFPESLDGRVRTLHPSIHGGLLADLRLESHENELREMGIEPFELVVSNLYPFVQTVASGAAPNDVIEQIDIGGPALVRASAKNHANVAIVTSPASYPQVLKALTLGGTTLAQRRRLAAEAFAHTAAYDTAVAEYFATNVARPGTSEAPGSWSENIAVTADLATPLRYGENSHQSAALYRIAGAPGIAHATQHGGKEMSYNNYVDADAALRAAYDHDGPAVAIIKHANPCGIATAPTLAEAHAAAHACDPVSAFGGVIAANRPIDRATAESIAPIFTEVVVAPGFEAGALEVLQAKKNLRLLEVPGGWPAPQRGQAEIRQISGGLLAQEPDSHFAPASDWSLVAGEAADAATLADLEFAWRAVRAVKSNAILLASGGASVGVGMGQVNRVDSCRLAVTRAGDRAAGSVAASDAFFPFADGLQILLDAGVRAVVQPGGSIRDEEVIAAAAQAGVTMYFTGERHFFH
ncbi:phosphoribosylaminoimidazolecarboxamide formyltransferase/IMP cyclohydrolase [Microbacteriaceae bacterium SG_E_30_P1]|uniref:Bifunctional purine biosynthesis protein PurH n=1 Tax=Antiquaquibacter oligotrophicus TaxID=2880260 RepID=A0ABT6KJY0_9MICO|nr:bifunctional phosphoribosylaminoimidazolecarboxamide formyltransferase/IMP cyclohydrolase [Antiquaquibacter oligotrophicus]MDH6179995.1 phosphoribosylaminoimidazolecarboxamide formyltransferase/IMP cyclohydrolase [Antiquaquibacter oligotrophicus]UDF14249.1 bifunctional phosphoribosylaminoimidazolecarboxamide formyltransferase/IMP cyclohydrolase [Antiquaquibacter oligotrophicus]